MSDCERYRSDPEAHAAHAEACEACAALSTEFERVDETVSKLTLDPKPEFRSQLAENLPLAPWEGARYRSWGLVIAVLMTLLVLVSGAFLAVGISPIRALRALGSTMLPLVSPFELAQSFSMIIASAPRSFHITIGIAFVVVNVLLLVLLRRPPRGYDA